MKAEDIRVGDYFMVEPSGMTIKVAAVHNKKVGYHAVTNRLEWVRIGLLRPIPITTEILLRNGFERDNETHISTDLELVMDGVDIFIIIFDDGDTVVDIEKNLKDDVAGANRLHHCEIKYVHQLQQAMRLCGITKEIKI